MSSAEVRSLELRPDGTSWQKSTAGLVWEFGQGPANARHAVPLRNLPSSLVVRCATALIGAALLMPLPRLVSRVVITPGAGIFAIRRLQIPVPARTACWHPSQSAACQF